MAYIFVLVSCYALSALGGSLHYVLHHGAPHGETACAADALPAIESDCDGEQHGAAAKTCQVCVSLARSLGTGPIVVTVAATVSAAAPNLPLASPAITMPYRPHVQRGPPVQV